MGIIQDAFTFAESNPGKRAAIFTKDYPHTDANMIQAKAIYPGIAFNLGTHEMKLDNGSKVQFRHCADLSGYHDYMGAEWHWIAFDPNNHPDEDTQEMLKRRIKEYRINAYCVREGMARVKTEHIAQYPHLYQ